MSAPDSLLPAVYDELRRMAAARLAAESPGHSLDATALVHEAYLRLRDRPGFADRSHFLAAAADAMRRLLVDHARAKRAVKRGGPARRAAVDPAHVAGPDADPDALLAVDEALTRLAAADADAAAVAKLRVFAGLSVEEAGDALGVSRATAYRNWTFARAWLAAALADGP